MLEKILKIISTIDSCKRIGQLEHCLVMIENFERDEKPRDPRIMKDMFEYYKAKHEKIEQNYKLETMTLTPIEMLENELKLLKRSKEKSIHSYSENRISNELHQTHIKNLNPLIEQFEKDIKTLNENI